MEKHLILDPDNLMSYSKLVEVMMQFNCLIHGICAVIPTFSERNYNLDYICDNSDSVENTFGCRCLRGKKDEHCG